jgi:phosphate-selective porin OprO and OprP
MKTIKLHTLLLSTVLAFSINGSAQQTTEDLINLLIQKQIISQTDADSVRAENAIKQQNDKEKQTKFQLFGGKPITLSGYTQVRFLSQQEAFKPDGLDIRRARLDFKSVINEHWDSRLQVDFTGTPKILDATISYKHRDWFKFTAGQFYIPFSLENTTADNKLEFIDRSQVVNALAARDKDVIGNQNGRDLGIQLSGSVIKIKDQFLIDYYLGGFNGAGINTVDNNESKDFSGRIVFHPFKNFDFGGSYYSGFDKWGTPLKDQVRTRYGTEFSYTYAFANIKGEYIQGQDGQVQKKGYYTQFTTFVYKKNIQLVARYDIYDTNIASERKGDITTNYVFGVNFYFNNWSKLQINYTDRVEEGKEINNDMISAQLQISF